MIFPRTKAAALVLDPSQGCQSPDGFPIWTNLPADDSLLIQFLPEEFQGVPTLKVNFSLALKSMRMVIWKVETCSMCFRVS